MNLRTIGIAVADMPPGHEFIRENCNGQGQLLRGLGSNYDLYKGGKKMGRQSAAAMQKSQSKQTGVDQILVPPETLEEYTRNIGQLISNRAYEFFERRGGAHGHDWEDWYQAESTVLQPVNNEVSDSGDEFVALIDVASYRPEDLKVTAESGHMKICGLSTDDGKEKVGGDTAAGYRAFLISYQFPAPINPTKTVAEIRDGLLEIRLPKAKPAPERSN
ncbi:MAG: Hsp20 family protein [Candidatus Acidiferrales bacterium]